MTAAISWSPVLTETSVSPEAPLDIDFPELDPEAALCIGLSIDSRHADTLRNCALRHTTADEHARAARFPDAEDGLRNLVGRMLLRVLAHHYGGMPLDQTIPANAWGKPDLSAYAIGCNVSHAGNQVWAALSRFPHVGIDVSSVLAPPGFQDMIAAFHPDEISMLKKAHHARSTMVRCWNRKEAVSKATGLGLSLPLRGYAVDCGAAPAGWLRVAPMRTACSDWTTTDLAVAKDYVAALAVQGRCTGISVLRLKC